MRGMHPRNLAGSRSEFGGAARLFFTTAVLALAFAFALLSSFAVAVPAFAQEETSGGTPDVGSPGGDVPALQDIPEEQQPEECEGAAGSRGGSEECRAALEDLAAEQPSGDEGGGSDDSGGSDESGGGSGGGGSGSGEESGSGGGDDGRCPTASETFLGGLASPESGQGWAESVCSPEYYSLTYVDSRGSVGGTFDKFMTGATGQTGFEMMESMSYFVVNRLASVVMVMAAWMMLTVISLINFASSFNLTSYFAEAVNSVIEALSANFFYVWLPVIYALVIGYAAVQAIMRDKVSEGFATLAIAGTIGAFSVGLFTNPDGFVNGYNTIANGVTNVAYTVSEPWQDGTTDPQTVSSGGEAQAQSWGADTTVEGANTDPVSTDSADMSAIEGFSRSIWQTFVFEPWSKLQLGEGPYGAASSEPGPTASELVRMSPQERDGPVQEKANRAANDKDGHGAAAGERGAAVADVTNADAHILGAIGIFVVGLFFAMLALSMSLLLLVIQAVLLILLLTSPIWLLFAVFPASGVATKTLMYFLGLNLEMFAYKLLLSIYVILVGVVMASASIGLAAIMCLVLALVGFRFKKDLIRLLTPAGLTQKLSGAMNSRPGAQPAGAATGGSSAYGGSEAPATRPSMVTRMGGSKAASAPGSASATAAGMTGAAGAAAGVAASPVTKPAKAVGKGVKGGASTLRKGSKGVRMAQTGEGKGLGRNAELLSRSEGKTGKAAFLGSKVKSARDAKKAAGGASMADRVNSIPASARRSPDNVALMGKTRDTSDGRKLLPLSEYARKGAGSRGSKDGPAKGTLNERMNGIAASRKRKRGAEGELSRSSDTANGGKYIPLRKFAKSTPDTNRSTPATGAAAGAAGAAAGSGLRGARDRGRDRVGGAANAAGVGQTGYADRPGRGEEPGIVGRSRNRMAAAKHLKDYQKRAMREAILRDGVAGGAKAASGGPQAAVAGATKGAATGAAKGTGAALGEYKNNFGDMAKGRDVSPEGKAKRAAQQSLQAQAEQEGASLTPTAQAERRRESGAYSGAQLKDDARSQIMGRLTGRDGANVSPDDPARESMRDTLERAEAGDSQAMAQINGADPQGDIDRREALALLGTEDPGDGPDGTGGGGASGIGAGAAGAAGAGAGAAGDAAGAANAAQDAQNGAAAGAAGMAAGAAGGAAAGAAGGAAASRGGASGSSADSGYEPDVAETGGQVERGIHRDSENFGAAAVGGEGSGDSEPGAADAGVDGAAAGVGDSGGDPDTGGVAGASGPGEDSGPAPEDAMMGIAGVPGGGSGDENVDEDVGEESGAIAEAPDGPDSFGVDAGSVPAGAAYEPSSGAIVGDGDPEGAFMAAAPAGFVAREGSEGEGRWEPLPATSESFAGPDGGGAWMDAHGYSPEGDGFLDSATAESWKAEDAELSSMQAAHNARSADLFGSYQSGDPGYDDKLGAWQAEGDALAAREEEVALGRRQQRLDSWDGSAMDSMAAPAAAAGGGAAGGGGGPPNDPPDDNFFGGDSGGDEPPDDGGSGGGGFGGGSGGGSGEGLGNGGGGSGGGAAGEAFEDRVVGSPAGDSNPSLILDPVSSDFAEDKGGSDRFGAFAAGAASGAVAGGIAGAAAGGLFGGGSNEDSGGEDSPSDLDRMDEFASGGSGSGSGGDPGEGSGAVSDADKLDNFGIDASPGSASPGDDFGGDDFGGDDLAGFDREARVDEVSRRGISGAASSGDDLAGLDRAAAGGDERPGGDFHRHNSHNLSDEFERTIDPGQYGGGGYEYDRKREIAKEMYERRTEDLEDTMESSFESEHQNRERFLEDARRDGQDVSDIERGWLNEARSRRRKLDS